MQRIHRYRTDNVYEASIDSSNREDALGALAELTDRLPRSRTMRRTVLDICTGEMFRKRLGAYLVDGLNKGIPSLFSDTKRLLDDEGKRNTLLSVVLEYKQLLEGGKTLEDDGGEQETEEASTIYIWLLYYLSQTYLYLVDYESALHTISTALAHTPVLPELHMMRARILKRSGDLLASEEAMSQARALDGQDRFLNAKHAKYLLSIDEVEKAEEIAGLFTRKEAENPLADLIDMQCLWFLLAEADSFKRLGKFGMALKRYHTVEKVMTEYFAEGPDLNTFLCLADFRRDL